MKKQNKTDIKHLERQRKNYSKNRSVSEIWICSYCKKKKHSSKFNKKFLCKVCHTEQVRYHRARNKERYRMLSKMRKYNLTEEQYLKLSKTCDCCGTAKNLGIDHDHITGAVRGVLCTTCNTALACLKDNPNLIMELFMYLMGESHAK